MTTTKDTTLPAAPRARRMARPVPEVPNMGPDADASALPSAEDNAAPPASALRPTKAALVLGLLRRTDGATLAELTEVTGWQAHSARAHLTGLRKKGRALEKTTRNGAACYRLVEAQ